MLRPYKGSGGALSGGGDFEDADLSVADGVGVVVDVDALDVGLALLEVEMFDCGVAGRREGRWLFRGRTPARWENRFRR